MEALLKFSLTIGSLDISPSHYGESYGDKDQPSKQPIIYFHPIHLKVRMVVIENLSSAMVTVLQQYQKERFAVNEGHRTIDYFNCTVSYWLRQSSGHSGPSIFSW